MTDSGYGEACISKEFGSVRTWHDVEALDILGVIVKRRESLCRLGRRVGLVRVNSKTFKYPDEANRTSENTVADHGIEWPVNAIQRVIAIGNTCTSHQ